MPKTRVEDAPPPRQEETRRTHTKQAKQEAKLMLKREQAKQGVQKAERKVHKAQSRLEDALTQLHTLEEELTNVRGQKADHNEQEIREDEMLQRWLEVGDEGEMV